MAKRAAVGLRKVEFAWGDRTFSEVIEDNIELSELTPDECENALNRAVGKYAYYSSLRADAKHMQSKATTDYKMWEAKAVTDVAANPDHKKLTSEKARMNQVLVDKGNEWKTHMKIQRDLELVVDKLYVLVQSFELMTKTIQSVLAMKRTELGTASYSGFASGRGDLLEDR